MKPILWRGLAIMIGALILGAAPSGAQGIITTVAGSTWIFRSDGGPAQNAPLGPIEAVAVDSAGNVFASDRGNHLVVKISTTGLLMVAAGNGIGGFSGDGGPASRASLYSPAGVAVDRDGNLYIATDHRIRKVHPDGTITTVAGGAPPGFGFSGDGGSATSATLRYPAGLAVDAGGSLYIADSFNHRVRKVGRDGTITTVAGNGVADFRGDGGPATSASLNLPLGVAVDAAGNLYIADSNNQRIRKVSPGGTITSVAGGGAGPLGDGGPATSASLYGPSGIAVDATGNLYIADRDSHRIRKAVPGGIITTVAGSGAVGSDAGGFFGDGAAATGALLRAPQSVAVDAAGNVYIADTQNERIRKLVPSGTISTAAGNGQFKFLGDGGPATSASLELSIPGSSIGGPAVAVDAGGNVYIADFNNHRVRKVSPTGTITTVAGNGARGFSGDGGPATAATLALPAAVALDDVGNLYIADSDNHRVRKVNIAGIITTFAGNGRADFSGDGGPATNAGLISPVSVALDAAGNLYIAHGVYIRKVSPAGIITTIAGNGATGFSGDGGPATSASLWYPGGVAVDSGGNVYIGDSFNHRVRKVTPGGTIGTVAGNGVAGVSGDGGPAARASLDFPTGVAVDAGGNLYIADSENQRIRKVGASGTITTVAGAGVADFSGDGGPATAAGLARPLGVTADVAGNLYIADTLNDRIRKVLVAAAAPAFSVSPTSLSFSATAGSAVAATRQLTLSSSIAGLAWRATPRTQTGGNWLSISPVSGQTPATAAASVDATNLAAGTYQGSIEISAPLATPSPQTVSVTFTVAEAQPAKLSVEPSTLSFQVVAGGAAPAPQTLRIENTGGGSLSWTAEAATATGNWLAVAPASGSATPGSPSTVQASVNPAGLAAGSYSGSIAVRSAAINQSATVSVRLQVAEPLGGGPPPPVLLLSQSSLAFRAIEGGGGEPPQSFGVLNIGGDVLDWTVQATMPWLRVSPSSGRSEARAPRVPLVAVSVDSRGLTTGFYTGLIRVTAAAAGNSPQVLHVDLQVLPRGTRLGTVVRPTGLIFVAAAGGSSPSSQEVSVAPTEATSVEFLSQPIGGDWVRRVPDSATASRENPGRIVVQPELGNLAAGIYRASLGVFTKNDGELHPVRLLFLVLPQGTPTVGQGIPTRRDGFLPVFTVGQESEPVFPWGQASLSVFPWGQASLPDFPVGQASLPVSAIGSPDCIPTQLLLQFASLFLNFNATVGWGTTVLVNARDDCGNPAVGGGVVLSFSSGEPALPLTDLKNGQYLGSWRPSTLSPQVVVTARGTWRDSQGRGLQGQVTATAQVGANPNPQNAFLSQGGVLLGAGFGRGPVAPGSIVSLFGRNLAAGDNLADRVPLPRSLGGVRVLIGGVEAPLFYAGPGQVNAQVPFEVGVDRQLQVLLETSGVSSAPEPLQTVSSRPGIFTLGPRFGNQGAILIANSDRLAMPPTSGVPSEPAQIGGVVSIYCTGLGSTDPAVASGQPGPSAEPLARVTTPVTVTIGGQPAAVSFAGLAPGFVGVYQVNVQVPAGIATGDGVPVVVTQGGFRSNTATIAVR